MKLVLLTRYSWYLIITICSVNCVPLIYCNQTKSSLVVTLRDCYDNGDYPSCIDGYKQCVQNFKIQSLETNQCIESCLKLVTKKEDCDVANCTLICCEKACKLIPGLQGAGVPEGCETIDPNLTIKIVIITLLFSIIVGSIILGVKCFGKTDSETVTPSKLVYQHIHYYEHGNSTITPQY